MRGLVVCGVVGLPAGLKTVDTADNEMLVHMDAEQQYMGPSFLNEFPLYNPGGELFRFDENIGMFGGV